MLVIDMWYCKVSHNMIKHTLRQLLIKKIPIRTLTGRPISHSHIARYGYPSWAFWRKLTVLWYAHIVVSIWNLCSTGFYWAVSSPWKPTDIVVLLGQPSTSWDTWETIIWAVATKQNKTITTSVFINHTVPIKMRIFVRNHYFRG